MTKLLSNAWRECWWWPLALVERLLDTVGLHNQSDDLRYWMEARLDDDEDQPSEWIGIGQLPRVGVDLAGEDATVYFFEQEDSGPMPHFSSPASVHSPTRSVRVLITATDELTPTLIRANKLMRKLSWQLRYPLIRESLHRRTMMRLAENSRRSLASERTVR